jgi:hypothetical protein
VLIGCQHGQLTLFMVETRERSRWRRPSRWVPLAVLGLLVAGLFVLRIVSTLASKASVNEVRSRGLPVNALELDIWYKRVPASENAALLFLEASREHNFPAKGMDPDESKETFKPGEPLPPKLADAVAIYVGKNALLLRKIDEAAELTASRYPIDLSRGPATLVPHLASVRRMAQLLKWAAIQRSAEGKPDEAVQVLRNGFALAASLEPEPLVISQYIRISCLSILMIALERVVNEHALGEPQLAALAAAIRRAEEQGKASVARSLVGERAMGIPLFDLNFRDFANLSSGAPPSDYELDDFAKVGAYGLRRLFGMQHRDLLFYLERMNEMEAASKLDFPRMLKVVDEINQGAEKELSEHRWKYMISQMMLPSLPSGAKKEALLAARLRCAEMALAIERYRAKYGGKLPRLDQLSPEFLETQPRDPVDNSALEYRLNEGKGYRVVAAASTALSNQGRKPTNRQDIAFTVVR